MTILFTTMVFFLVLKKSYRMAIEDIMMQSYIPIFIFFGIEKSCIHPYVIISSLFGNSIHFLEYFGIALAISSIFWNTLVFLWLFHPFLMYYGSYAVKDHLVPRKLDAERSCSYKICSQ
jgi:arginine exporter protein ArgO